MKNKIMSLLTLLCIVLSSAAFGQSNTVKRNSCTSFGCSTLPVELTLSSSFGSATRTIDCPDAGESYATFFSRIKVKVSGKYSTGTYYLPTATGSSTLIPATDLDFGTYGYGVSITKTASNQFTLTLTRYDYPTP